MGRMIDSSMASPQLAVVASPVRQNVTFAVNYAAPRVENFVPSFRHSNGIVPSVTMTSLPKTNLENSPAWINRGSEKEMLMPPAPPLVGEDSDKSMRKVTLKEDVKDISNIPGGVEQPRRPRRDLKPKLPPARSKNRVKYDMNLVPGARRNRDFIRHYGQLWLAGRDDKESREVDPAPFVDNASVVWIPNKRAEWEDCVSEMTAVCTSAFVRRRIANGSIQKPYYAPLSKEYIRDRVDIDDPLEGYQIRHKGGGWLQGFILWTNFTTWTHYFKWDSLHPQCGIAGTSQAFKTDSDGRLSAELESQPRSGDPLGGGIVHSTVAEISLLGGIGCGEYLLRMALDDIMSRSKYKYVVLQATDSSRPFYERFGFIRVGAVSIYGSKDVLDGNVDGTPKEPIQPNGIVGYRHWTYAHETSSSLDMHGGPSYMMALRLPSAYPPRADGRKTFLEAMKHLFVADKPKILQLGGPATPAPKKKKLSAASPNPYLKTRYDTSSSRDERRKRRHSSLSTPGSQEPRPSMKRRNIGEEQSPSELMTPPPAGKSLSYAQKQYQSVWLAVPPTSSDAPSRKPPRRRSPSPESRAPQSEQNARPSSRTTPRKVSNADELPSSQGAVASTSKSSNRDKTLRKQKVVSFPRSSTKINFYNKVVQRKDGNEAKYYFVLNFNEEKSFLKLVPLVRQGELVGKRLGRPRYKAVLTNHSAAPFVPASEYDVVPAYMVTKTPLVASETWDILE